MIDRFNIQEPMEQDIQPRMIYNLPLDILWSHVLPLLELQDYTSLYDVHPKFRVILKEYKQWDVVYKETFSDDCVDIPELSGFEKVYKRVKATPIAWGRIARNNFSTLPQPMILDERYPIKQLVFHNILLVDGNLWRNVPVVREEKYHLNKHRPYSALTRPKLRWQREDNWDSTLKYFLSHLSLFQDTMYCSEPVTKDFVNPLREMLKKMEIFSGELLLFVKGIGLVCYYYSFGDEDGEVLLAEAAIPQPVRSFCPLDLGYYLILTPQGQVTIRNYQEPFLDEKLDPFDSFELPPKIKSVHSLDFRFHVKRSKNALHPVHATKGESDMYGNVFLGEDGKVYSWAGIHSRTFAFGGLKDIVKVATSDGALFALDKYGSLFFIGSTIDVEPGVDTKNLRDFVCDAIEDWPPNTLWMCPGAIEREDAMAGPNCKDFYALEPLYIPIKGRVVDVCVFQKRVNVLVVGP